MTYQHEQELMDVLKNTNEALQEMAQMLFDIKEDLKEIKEREVDA